MTSVAEQNVLGAILLDPTAYWRVADLLKPEHFTIPDHRTIWGAFCKLHDAGTPVDVFTVAEMCPGMDAYLVDLASQTPSAANVRAYAEVVRAGATTRRVKAVGERIAAQGLLDEGLRLLGEIADDEPGRLVTAKDAAREMWAGVMARYEAGDEMSGLATGIPKLDALLGGLQPGRVYALGARAKMGKSVLAWQIAMNVALAGHTVAGFSLEMTNEELIQRLACNLAGVRSYGILHPKAMDDTEWARLSSAMAQLTACPLLLSDRMDMTIEQIEAHARQAKAKLIVLDYLQLVEQPRLETEATRLAHITRRVKKMAKDCDCSVIEVFQVNRGNEAGAIRPPRPSDARGSGTIEQDCDAMLLLHRPSYYDIRAEKGLRLELALNRSGPTGVIRMEDELAMFRFGNSDDDWHDAVSRRDDDL